MKIIRAKIGLWRARGLDLPFCRQSVRIGAYGCRPPPGFVEKRRLRDHMVGGECIAYLNPRKARKLMSARS